MGKEERNNVLERLRDFQGVLTELIGIIKPHRDKEDKERFWPAEGYTLLVYEAQLDKVEDIIGHLKRTDLTERQEKSFMATALILLSEAFKLEDKETEKDMQKYNDGWKAGRKAEKARLVAVLKDLGVPIPKKKK